MAKTVPLKLPDATLVTGDDIIGRDESPAPAALVRAVLAAWEAKIAADDAKKVFDAAQEAVIDQLHSPCSVVIPGVCRMNYSVRQTVKVADPERLAAVLGERYGDLVVESMSYKAEPRLVSMSTDADEPLQPAIAACLKVSEAETLTFRAEK
ncbi:MAG: hypothetical protein AB1482_13130 [Pseudomonadota bacterium]